jgi:elongation factor 2
LRKRSKEDNTIQVDIDEETGETTVSGLGELNIETKVERHLEEEGIDIEVCEPIVVFREGITKNSPEVMVKSPNRHNKLEVYEENVFVDSSIGIKNLCEIQEYLLDAFKEFCDEGPLAGEPVIGLMVKLHDAKLHEDAIHRGPSHMIPTTKDAMRNGFLQAEAED